MQQAAICASPRTLDGMAPFYPDRKSALHALIEYSLPIDNAIARLANEPWDAPEPLVYLSAEDVERILQRFLDGELTHEQVTDWADLLECREDIAPKPGQEVLTEVLFRLANPYLASPVTRAGAEEMQIAVRSINNAV